MRRIPVDTSRITCIGTGKAAARAQYAEYSDGSRKRIPDAQAKDELGTPLWTVDVLVDDPDADRAEVIGVKIASHDMPVTKLGQPVRFVNLTALGYVAQGTNRVAYSFTADGIEGAAAAPKAA